MIKQLNVLTTKKQRLFQCERNNDKDAMPAQGLCFFSALRNVEHSVMFGTLYTLVAGLHGLSNTSTRQCRVITTPLVIQWGGAELIHSVCFQGPRWGWPSSISSVFAGMTWTPPPVCILPGPSGPAMHAGVGSGSRLQILRTWS